MYKRCLVILSVLIMTLPLFFSPASSIDISDPRYTNDLIGKVDTPKMEPGERGEMTLHLKNPYPEDFDIENVTLEVEIYHCVYLDKNKSISEVRDPPVFSNGEIKEKRKIEEIKSGESERLPFTISSFDQTEEGVYSIRFELTFWQDGEKEVMKSRGHFSTSELKQAKYSNSEKSSSEIGGFNTSMLDVSGILPETSFEVKEKLPRWPQYALGIITGVSGVLAVMFYMQEKYGSFPWLEEGF